MFKWIVKIKGKMGFGNKVEFSEYLNPKFIDIPHAKRMMAWNNSRLNDKSIPNWKKERTLPPL